MGRSTSARGQRGAFGDFVREVRAMLDPYRPELHYMRGPGPKWRAKHAVSHAAAPADTRSVPGLARVNP
ncbi:MAG: hypothetical protein IT536_01465 [Hyphomicrobiales bacterium]|nr:hypothetical protein [Hyphomicrobiales bacterium]